MFVTIVDPIEKACSKILLTMKYLTEIEFKKQSKKIVARTPHVTAKYPSAPDNVNNPKTPKRAPRCDCAELSSSSSRQSSGGFNPLHRRAFNEACIPSTTVRSISTLQGSGIVGVGATTAHVLFVYFPPDHCTQLGTGMVLSVTLIAMAVSPLGSGQEVSDVADTRSTSTLSAVSWTVNQVEKLVIFRTISDVMGRFSKPSSLHDCHVSVQARFHLPGLSNKLKNSCAKYGSWEVQFANRRSWERVMLLAWLSRARRW